MRLPAAVPLKRLQASELEILGADTVMQGSQPAIFRTLEQAKYYKLMLQELTSKNDSDETLCRLLDYVLAGGN